MIRLVAFDLDGTLMGHDLHISASVRKAIARTQEAGVVVTLATGRMFSATVPFAKQLGIRAPLICYQGGWVQAAGEEILHRTPLSSSLAQKAIQLGETRNWHTVLYADGRISIDALVHPLSFYTRLLGPDPTVVNSLHEVLSTSTPDKVLYVAEPEDIPAMARVLRANFAGRAEIVRSHAMFIEVVPRGVNKGNALRLLAAHLGIARADVLAVGDQENDLPMIQWAGIGVAIGNAVPKVREAADWIAPSLDEDGAAAVLERFALQQREEG